jgi:hypothetical protein
MNGCGNYTEVYNFPVSIGSDGNTIIPDENFIGNLTVPVFVDDGEAENSQSNTFGLLVTVIPVNDTPVMDSIADTSTNEDTPLTITVSSSDVDTGTGNGDENTPTYSAVSSSPDDVAVQLMMIS